MDRENENDSEMHGAESSLFKDALDDLIAIVSSKLREKDTSARLWSELALPLLCMIRPYMYAVLLLAAFLIVLLAANMGLLCLNYRLMMRSTVGMRAHGLGG